MKRIIARFDSEDDAEAAEHALNEAGLEPERPRIDNPFFNPTIRMPEERGLVWGGLLGGVIGLVLFQAINMDLLWVPRFSPMMSADEFAIPVLGLGLGIAIGGFIGGVLGTLRPIPEPEGPEVAVKVPDDRIDRATEVIRTHGATAVSDRVTYHENPEEWRRDRSGRS